MQENYQTTLAPTVASTEPTGKTSPFALWEDVNNILLDDGANATWGAYIPGQGASIIGSEFGFDLPPTAFIDGIEVNIQGSSLGNYVFIGLGITGTTPKDTGTLNGTYGSPTDTWGKSSISLADLEELAAYGDVEDISGGDGIASMDYMSVTVYWHIDPLTAPADVPTRVEYKTYSRDGKFLGLLPNVTTPFAFSQDINTAGSTLQIDCGRQIDQDVTTEDLLTESSAVIQTENEDSIQATVSTVIIARGATPDEAIFKNSNRVHVWVYNYWYPNGKLMFSGQVNRVSFRYGNGATIVRLSLLSDGLDLSNYIARGFPFTYTNDVSQTAQNGYVTALENAISGGFQRYGQTFTTGAAVDNVGSLNLLLQGSANVMVALYDAPGGNLIGSVTKSIADGAPTVESFNFPQLLGVDPSTQYFAAIFLGSGQSINIYRNSTSVYAGGQMYEAYYAGGGGGGAWSPITGDLYFVSKYGTPTTSITFTNKDPVTDMASDVLADYNTRGGYIRERNFEATGLSLDYGFIMASVFDVVKKVIELSPTGFYSYIDLGTAEMDILPMSETADFTVVRGKDVNSLDLSLSIEQVQNYLLYTGGEVSPGVNLYKQYQDALSSNAFGLRTGTKTDNRVTDAPTANAVGETYIEENAGETQETSVTVLSTTMDTTLLVPGKTIGFRNFGSFIDDMVLQIVRREFNLNSVTLTLGRLPIRMNDEVQRISRELLNEQTANNPSAPN